jgi:hypothetical protein
MPVIDIFREDKLFFDAISSVHEFQTPLLSAPAQSSSASVKRDLDDLDSSTMGKYKESRRQVFDRLSSYKSVSHFSESIEVI